MGRTRREVIRWLGAAPAALGLGAGSGPALADESLPGLDDGWNRGDVSHLIPTASHDRFLIKASFARPRPRAPVLAVEGRKVVGSRTDSEGRFWQFDVPGLESSVRYALRLVEADGRVITDPWPLCTLPHPLDPVARLRILTYTCAGGDEALVQPDGVPIVLPLATRRRLLRRGLSFAPDIVIANGDQVYYDQRSMLENKPPQVIEAWTRLLDEIGYLDPHAPIMGSSNETVLKRVGDRQIAQLYGVSLRSTPTFMLTDDHDLFENDEAHEGLATLPPRRFLLEAARALQHMYWPEFLPDPHRSGKLPGSGGSGRATGTSESFGTIRYGRLFEALLYDTKRYCSVAGADAFLIPPQVERWLADRARTADALHLAHVPSTPIGWSAGKWGEWYPDVLGQDGLTVAASKPYWPKGWWNQHQRILEALAVAEPGGARLIMSGDLHQFSAGRIRGSGELDLSEREIFTAVVGPLGTGAPAFPSAHRGVLAQPPAAMQVDEIVPPLEKNGFTLVDVAPAKVSFAFYAWRPPEPEPRIDTLPATEYFEIPGA